MLTRLSGQPLVIAKSRIPSPLKSAAMEAPDIARRELGPAEGNGSDGLRREVSDVRDRLAGLTTLMEAVWALRCARPGPSR